MGGKQSVQTATSETTSQSCAATLMETVPLIMQVIRADMRAIGATTLSVP
jgi:hypothetical protein